jgi:RNA polymerase sigma-70 factor (ECF subfamily)
MTSRAAIQTAPDLPADPPLVEGRDVLDFEQVYREHFPFVWRNLRRVGVPESALDDAAQDVFVVVYRRLAELTGPRLVRPWLSAILLRVAADHRRRARRKDDPTRSEADGPGLDSIPDPRGKSPQTSAEEADRLRLLHRVLDDLDWPKREVFVLAELEQMSSPEIAEALGIPVNTVYSRLRTARKEFSQALARHKSSDEWRLR